MTATTYKKYTIELPVFSGPLDLLLYLIERQELDITAISLVKVTEQYLAQMEEIKRNRVEQLIDFLVMGARLVQIKSRALLPQTPVVYDEDEEEEDPAAALVRQLRRYKQFKQTALWLADRENLGLRSYLRLAPPPKLEKQLDMSGITVETLIAAVEAVLARSQELEESVSIAQPRRITIESQIESVRRRIKERKPFLFHDLLSTKTTAVEVGVTLLAVLELIKREEIKARQTTLFGPIEIMAGDAAGVAASNGTPPAPPHSPENR